MSLTSALSAANSGLSAAARSAELISTNVANALTEGYGRREIRLAAATVGGGGGVQVLGVDRVVDQVAIGQRRFADAALGQAQQFSSFYQTMEVAIGTPDNPSSLTGRIAQLETSLVSAMASPESDSQLRTAVNSAVELAQALNFASTSVQNARLEADQRIGAEISVLNSSLSAIAEMNDQIGSLSVSGSDVSGLMDQRQKMIDQISQLVPIRELPREYGRVALITTNGTILVDNHAASFNFSATPTIVPEMTVESGGLSGLSLSNAESSAGSAMDAISGGTIFANFVVRDSLSTEVQDQLDGLAQELIERTSQAAVDPTLGGGPGLFTDDNAGFDLANKVGVASRVTVNSRLDEGQGGEAWRLRDGIGATISGPSGNIEIISSILGSLGSESPSFGQNFALAAANFVSEIGVSRNQHNLAEAFASTQVSTFREAEGRYGVDTDQEMQKLLVVEQSYAANAKIIQAIDEMMQSLLRI